MNEEVYNIINNNIVNAYIPCGNVTDSTEIDNCRQHQRNYVKTGHSGRQDSCVFCLH